MAWTKPEPKWVPEEYPKALNEADEHGLPKQVFYPQGHPRQGEPVVFHSADEEKAYKQPAPPAKAKSSK